MNSLLPGTIVGRDRELSQIEGLLAEAQAGNGHVILTSGDPGIGKTALARATADRAGASGYLVLWARCWEEGGAPAFWPWVQILRRLVRRASGKTALGSLRGRAGLLESLIEGKTSSETDHSADEGVRFATFDAATDLLIESAEQQPALLIIDDLHAADVPSLLLLQHLSRRVIDSRVLVLATHRIPQNEGRAEARPLISDLEGTRLHLAGLSLEDVEVMVRATALGPAGAIAGAVHKASEGNPLFATELLQLVAQEGFDPDRPLPIPRGVGSTIQRRLELLPVRTYNVLRVASVIGRDFSLAPIVASGIAGDVDVSRAIVPAISAGLVHIRDEVAGLYSFSHGLVRDAIYGAGGGEGNSRIHARIAEVLRELHTRDLDAYIEEIAHHLLHGLPESDLADVVEVGMRSGRRALELLAQEEARGRFERLLPVATDESHRAEILIALGEACWCTADETEAHESFTEALRHARASGRSDLLSEAALGYAGPNENLHTPPDAMDVIDEALRAADGKWVPRLLSRSATLPQNRWRPESLELSEQAVVRARSLGDPATLAEALRGRLLILELNADPEAMLVPAEELLQVARVTGDPHTEIWGRGWKIGYHLMTGEIVGVDDQIAQYEALARRLGQSLHLSYAAHWRTYLAGLRGEFAEAEHHNAEAGGPIPEAGLLVIRRSQGRLPELDDLFERIEQGTHQVVWQALCALFQHWRGRSQRAAGLAERCRQAWEEPRGFLYSACAFLAPIAIERRDRDRAEHLYEVLTPRTGRLVTFVESGYLGPVDQYLGELATFLDRPDDANAHFVRAEELNRKLGARPELIRTLVARFELDREQRFLDEARMLAEEIGAVHWQDEIETLVGSSTVGAELGHPVKVVFRRGGDYWTVGEPSSPLRLKHSKGLGYIACLLAEPGREFRALDLGGVAGDATTDALAAESGEPLLDPVAKQAYRRRITELREQLEDAEADHDLGQADRARTELDLLTQELAAAVGLGGRDRTTSDAAERARLAVSKAIRTAIKRIEAEEKALGWHLRTAISTGHLCSYQPGPHDRIDWQL